jgi:Dna[CI] antecedent, DciA
MRKKNDVSISEALQDMIKEYRLGPQLNESRVKTLWHELMGKTISTYTSNISVRNNVLYLTILSAPLKHELSYSKDKIKDLLNGELGEEFIREVVIR